MAIIFNDNFIDIDLNSGNIHRSFQNHVLARGDENCFRFGVRCKRDNELIDLTGCTVVGLFIRPTEDTVVIAGHLSTDNKTAFVLIPKAACAYAGNFTLTIKVTNGSSIGAMRIVDGTIIDDYPGQYVDPGNTIPSTESIEALIAAAEAAEETLAAHSVTATQLDGDVYKIVVATTA